MKATTRLFIGGLLLAGTVAPAARSSDHTLSFDDKIVASKIRNEGIRNSQVSEILFHLSDVIGPRLTGSDQLKQANDWTAKKLASFGLRNVRVEPYEFGQGWNFTHSSVHLITPSSTPMLALPYAWTSGTDGPERGEAMIVTIDSEEDMETYRGKLTGKVLFLDEARAPVPAHLNDVYKEWPYRFSDADLKRIEQYDIDVEKAAAVDESPEHANLWQEDTAVPEEDREAYLLEKAMQAFFVEEGALATVRISKYDMGLVTAGGELLRKGDPVPVTGLNMAAEHYNRVIRLLEHDIPVTLEIDVRAELLPDGPAHNTFADIPGTGKSKEIVMVGAHLDSWHAGTGASDNGAGVAITLEAVRILKALNIHPKRTVRVALWGGEEQDSLVHNNFYLGSGAFADRYLGTRHEAAADQLKYPQHLRNREPGLLLKKSSRNITAYYNIDNGSGRIRGIWGQDNHAAAMLFEHWIAAFKDLGVATVTTRSTYGTDHLPFDLFGVPGFQFIQDPLEYGSHIHHSNMDLFDHASEADMKQAASVLAFFLYKTATMDEPIPRKNLRNSLLMSE